MTSLFTPFYLIGMWIYSAAVALASLSNTKAKQLARGRRDTWKRLKNYDNSEKCIWIHAASLGEFEQGRPIIEAIKQRFPNKKIVLTFYSPSGYEIRKNYNLADFICYLPADGPQNARRFVSAINPEMAFFVKYEFWHFFLKSLKNAGVPVYGVSMIFRQQQAFFKGYGAWFRRMLKAFDHLYIQDQQSGELLKQIGIENFTVAGDTRFDRVARIAANSANVELCERFVSNAKITIVSGSSWEPDEERLLPYINDEKNDVKLIIAPHETDDERVSRLCQTLKVPYFRFTRPDEGAKPEESKVMVIDTIGLLSSIYKYGQIAYIGGGFGKGIHNTLEAATYGMPVIFGPNHKRFKEALDLLDCKAAFTYNTAEELKNVLDTLRFDLPTMEKAKAAAAKYVNGMCGATDRIMHDLFSK